MAIIQCKECNNKYEETLGSCPNCGYSVQLEQQHQVQPPHVAAVADYPVITPKQPAPKSKITAGFLCLFLWFCGVHEFYLRRTQLAFSWMAVSMLIIICTPLFPILSLICLGVPIVLAIRLWTTPDAEFNKKYNNPAAEQAKVYGLAYGVSVAGAIIFMFIAVAKIGNMYSQIEQLSSEIATCKATSSVADSFWEGVGNGAVHLLGAFLL